MCCTTTAPLNTPPFTFFSFNDTQPAPLLACPPPPTTQAGLAQAAGVFYNFSGSLTCFNFRQGVNPETSDDGHLWDYQVWGGQRMIAGLMRKW